MHLEFTTCLEIYGNGAPIGMVNTPPEEQSIQPDQKLVIFAYCGADPGSIVLQMPDRRSGMLWIQAAGTQSTGSACSWSPNLFIQ